MGPDYYIEVECLQKNPGKQVICGDVFMSEKIKEEGRTLLVLSDGLGSGVKANVLGTLTASMVLNYMRVNKDIRKAAEVIMQTLPICSKRKASYSTLLLSILNAMEKPGLFVTIVRNVWCFVAWNCFSLNVRN